MTDLTKEELKAWQNHLDKWRKDGVLPQPKMIYKAGLNDGRSESQKHITELEEFAKDVLQWSKAYPEKIFTKPTPAQVDAVCKMLGFRIDRIASMVLREYTKRWGDRAAELLKEGGGDD